MPGRYPRESERGDRGDTAEAVEDEADGAPEPERGAVRPVHQHEDDVIHGEQRRSRSRLVRDVAALPDPTCGDVPALLHHASAPRLSQYGRITHGRLERELWIRAEARFRSTAGTLDGARAHYFTVPSQWRQTSPRHSARPQQSFRQEVPACTTAHAALGAARPPHLPPSVPS